MNIVILLLINLITPEFILKNEVFEKFRIFYKILRKTSKNLRKKTDIFRKTSENIRKLSKKFK